MEIMLVGFAELIGSIPAAFEELLKLLNFLLELFSFGGLLRRIVVYIEVALLFIIFVETVLNKCLFRDTMIHSAL